MMREARMPSDSVTTLRGGWCSLICFPPERFQRHLEEGTIPFFGFLFSTLFSILYYSQMESEPYSISTKEATYSKPCLFNEVYRRFGEKSWGSRKRAIYCSNKVNFKWNTKPFWKHPEASTSERGAPVNFYSTWSLLLPVLSSFFFFLFSLLLFYFFISVKIG